MSAALWILVSAVVVLGSMLLLSVWLLMWPRVTCKKLKENGKKN